MLSVMRPRMLSDFKPRLYQEKIFSKSATQNCLVVLPTGLGKTALSIMLCAHRLTLYPKSKVVLLGPTKPLIDQHRASFAQHLNVDEESLVVFNGSVPPAKRAQLWERGRIFFSTPQGFENDLLSRRISLEDVSLIVFDEAHHATGDYAYVTIAKQYIRYGKYARILALTASPGSEIEKIQEVCDNLAIECIEARTEDDPDVKPYVQKREVRQIKVELPPKFKDAKISLDAVFKQKVADLASLGIVQKPTISSRRELLGIQSDLIKQMSGDKSFELLKSVSLVSELMKIYHGIELLETQGAHPCYVYLDRLVKDAPRAKTKAVKNLVQSPLFKEAYVKVEDLVERGVRHPKLDRLNDLISESLAQNPQTKLIVFTQYRDTAAMICKFIESAVIKPKLFIGQGSKRMKGLTQKQQKAVLDEFRAGEFNVLVATSVAEEGLDIPTVDTVVFFEPIPSAIRTIQRAGRTARHGSGVVNVLIAKNTRDEAYRWSAFHKESRMNRFLDQLKRKLVLEPRAQATLMQYDNATPAVPKGDPSEFSVRIVADHREKGSRVLKTLLDMPLEMKLEQLNCADYVLSARVGVEYKNVRDFVDSILDGRLINQLKDLRLHFDRPLVVVEGVEDVYQVRNVHPNAIRGMLATITISFGIPIVYTKHAKETAELLLTIAKREQEDSDRNFSYHSEKRNMSDKELQEYVVSSLPNVGPSIARDLLTHFKTIKAITRASTDELCRVSGVGLKTAERIKAILEREYVDI